MSKRKVLHIFGTMNPAGAELRTLDIMRILDNNKIEVDRCHSKMARSVESVLWI